MVKLVINVIAEKYDGVTSHENIPSFVLIDSSGCFNDDDGARC